MSTPELPAELPFPLSLREGAASETYALETERYHVAIGGMPFMLAPHPERPLLRELTENRKEQIDQQDIPGEQSLVDWWLRSQSTFIGGAGLLYQDPDITNRWAIQYGESTGLSPWTNGKLTLLRATAQDLADASADRHLVLGYNDGTDRYWSAVGSVLRTSDGTSSSAITWGGTETIQSLTSDGTHYYAADEVGVYSGEADGTGSLAWNTGSADVVLGWAKGRLMMGMDNALYELAGGSPPTLPTAVFTHLNSSWRWTSIAEGTNAIYASGYAGSQSSIYKLELDDVGGTPTLDSGGVQAAQLPHGEIVLALSSYLGTYIGIGTSRGFRVGQIDDRGDIVYGPLLLETPSGVRSMVGYDRFFFVAASDAIEGASGLWRVDLGQTTSEDGPTPSLRHAWATDLQAHASGEVDSVTLLGNSDRCVFTVRGSGSYVEAAEELEPTGMLLTGRVRYNTLTDKIFKTLTVRTPNANPGTLSVSVLDPTGGESTVLSVTGGQRRIKDVLLSSPITAAEWLQLRIRFTRDATDTSTGPEVHGWQFKALPGEPRQRMFTLPLLCFDYELDTNGQRVGREGRTGQRLERLEAIARRGDAVTYQDLGANTSAVVLIDALEFRQTAPFGAAGSTWGGYLYVRLRTIADV